MLWTYFRCLDIWVVGVILEPRELPAGGYEDGGERTEEFPAICATWRQSDTKYGMQSIKG